MSQLYNGVDRVPQGWSGQQPQLPRKKRPTHLLLAIGTFAFVLILLGYQLIRPSSWNSPQYLGQQQDFKDLSDCAASYDDLLSDAGWLAKDVQKQGVLNLDYWYPPRVPRLTGEFNAWLMNISVINYPDDRKRAPLSAACTVLVNHHYKFIFIKNTKTAGTTLFLFFGAYCNQGRHAALPADHPMKKNCLKRFDMSEVPTEEAAAKLWAEYFVFTVSRNPYSRAGSAYDYMLGRRKGARTGACSDPPFQEFCRQPPIVGKQDRVFACLSDPLHDFYHVEPIAQCVTTHDGRPAVDFIIRHKHIDDDFAQVVQIINERRDPSLKPFVKPQRMTTTQTSQTTVQVEAKARRAARSLVEVPHAENPGAGSLGTGLAGTMPVHESGVAWAALGVANQGDVGGGMGARLRRWLLEAAGTGSTFRDKHTAKFEQCGKPCVDGIAQYYREDVELFGFPACVKPSSARHS